MCTVQYPRFLNSNLFKLVRTGPKCFGPDQNNSSLQYFTFWTKSKIVPIICTVKGQLISKCPYKNQFLPKYQRIISALKFFVATLGLPKSFFGLPVFMILLTKSPGSPKSFQEAPRKLQKISGQKSWQYFCCYFGPNDDTKKAFRN